jgi:tetratricopeptide (TPR) repeat protein
MGRNNEMVSRWLCILLSCAVVGALAFGQLALPSHEVRDTRLGHIAEPLELAGEPPPMPIPPTPALLQFVQSKAISAADPYDAKTLAPAIQELNRLIRVEPTNSDFYFLRASLSCYVRANSPEILDDINHSISLSAQSTSTAYSTVREHYALKAKIEFEGGHFEDSMRDLDAAIKEDYESAKDVFNDGQVKPTTTTQPCTWTQPDLDALQRRFPQDYRPPLYLALYLTFFYSFDLNSDYGPVLDAFHQAAMLNPAAPLPAFFIGELYSTGRLGGMMSVKNAECLDDVVPRTSPCLALDELHRTGVRSLTQAIALDPRFGPAYSLRAIAFSKLKQHRQAIRDYDKVLELTPTGEAARIAYNDRGLEKVSLGGYQSAVLDFTQSIAMGCKESCGSYHNRAEAYVKLRNYPKAIEDFSASIKQTLSHAVFLMNIDQFRRIYPEYDSVPDDALCEKLRAMFFSTMKYADFAKQFLIDAKDFKSTVLPDLYLERGDAYTAMNQAQKANAEYDRVSRGFPERAAISFVEKNGQRIRKVQ